MDIEQAIEQAKIVGLEQIAERCKTDLFYLCKYILASNPDLVTEHTHRDLCEITKPLLPGFDIEKNPVNFTPMMRMVGDKPDELLSDQFDPNRNKLMLLLPRGTFKSSLVTIGFTLQMALNDPDCRTLIDSETYGKSKNFLAEIKGHLEGNQKYRAIYKHIWGKFPDANKKDGSCRWTDAAIDLSSRTKVTKEPSISCSGVDRSINGMHYDLIIEDDLHSEKNVTNKEQIQQVIDHRNLANSLLDPGKPKITIGTRWDFQDAYNDVLVRQRASYNIMVRKAIEDDDSLFFPERLTREFLAEQRRDQGAYIYSCNPAGSKITMADWTEKNIEDIKKGDIVVGWNVDDKRSKLKPSRVIQVGSRVADIVEVTTASGRKFKCTPDHNWYVNPSGHGSSRYLPAKVGRKLMVFGTVEYEERDEWLGGIFDGEGACDGSTIRIAQSQSHNPDVCDEIERRLNLNGFDFAWDNFTSYYIKGGVKERIRFMKIANPIKKHKIERTLWKSNFIQEKDRVVSVVPAGKATVYSMQTVTGNYICHGILSRNCQYQNNPVDDETATFKHSYFKNIKWDLVKDKPINWCVAVDPSMEGPYSDYAAFVLAGLDAEGNLYVRQVHRAKMNYAGIITLMFDWYQRYEPRRMALETIATQSNISYMLNAEQKQRGIWLPLKEIKSRSSSKEDRIRALAPYYEYGRVFHVEECNQLEDLEYELTHFPKGANDDMIDALATILEIATPPSHKQRYSRDEKIKRTTFKPRSLVTGI